MTETLALLTSSLSDRYHVVRELGAGGMATVYLAHDLKHDRDVAIKVLRPELAAVIGAERFLSEIKTTANLQHPHILPLFDSGTADGQLYYVMPYVEGDTLRDRLNRETQLPVADAVRLATEVANALDYAHKRGVVHRDIKPENILLQHGSALVADFGIALAVQHAGSGRMTQTGMSLGTPQYMSPEQAMGEKNVDARADIYALGAVTYEMLVGEPPFTGPSVQAIVAKVMSDTPKEVTAHRKTVPHNIAAAVGHALQKLPADRFTSAGAFAEALGNVSFGGRAAGAEGQAAIGASARGGAKGWLRVASGLVLLALAGGAGAALMYRAPVPAQVARFKMSLPNGQNLGTSTRYDTPVALSPDGSRIAYVAFDSGTGAPNVHVRAIDQFATISIPGTETASNLFFSPDGLWIGYVSAATRVMYKVSTAGGPVSQIVADAGLSTAPSWGDDHTIVYSSRSGRLARVRDGGGEPTSVLDTNRYAGTPVMLPGSRAVLATLCDAPGPQCAGVHAIDLVSRKVKMLVPNASRAWYLPSGHLVYGTNRGALFAAPFDLKRLEITGASVAVLDGLGVGSGYLAWAAISRSGTMAYVSSQTSGMNTVVQVDRAGREVPLVTKPGPFDQPRFSPDGQQLVLHAPDAKSVEQIWIHDRASATTRQLTFEGQSTRPAWSPDGKRVVFSGTRGAQWRIWTAPADGSSPGEAADTSLDLLSNAAVSWTRDGKYVVWDGQMPKKKGAGGDDIYAIPMTGTDRKLQVAVATPAQEQSGEVSPDGKWIAYSSDDAGKDQIYIQPFLVPGGRTLVSAGAAREAVWASNNELVFVNTESDSVTLARLEFGPTVKVTRTALFDVRPYKQGTTGFRNYDVSRDGKSFVFIKPTSTSVRVEPTIVLNWMEEVKRLMAAAGIK